MNGKRGLMIIFCYLFSRRCRSAANKISTLVSEENPTPTETDFAGAVYFYYFEIVGVEECCKRTSNPAMISRSLSADSFL